MRRDNSYSAVFTENYVGSKAYGFSQLFGSYASVALFAFDGNARPDNSKFKQTMLEELQKVLNFPDHGTFNLTVLNQLIKILKDVNWDDREQFRAAVQQIREIRDQH